MRVTRYSREWLHAMGETHSALTSARDPGSCPPWSSSGTGPLFRLWLAHDHLSHLASRILPLASRLLPLGQVVVPRGSVSAI